MPLARIDIPDGKPDSYGTAIGEVVYEMLCSILNVPRNDRFQIIARHAAGTGLILDPNYLGIARSPEAIIIQITLNEGRTTEAKQTFYAALADALHAGVGLRREDLMVSLVEVKKENWSFGNGIAQYV
ncbi:tautomerase family protein [Thioclava sp. BHET1]|nr:tautomerase family protein [Thioclava sp. BHET1]